MKRNDPLSNNPTNPLEKVAALTINRGTEQTKRPANITTVPVQARLNFKKSRHLTGRAKDRQGHPINISFSMAISNAHFELFASFADESPIHGQLTLSKLAHEVALTAPVSVRKKSTTRKNAKAGAKGSARAVTSTNKSSAEIGASIDGAADIERSETSTKNLAYKSLNISVTGAGNRATWDIQPIDGTGHLNGEVFLSSDEHQILAATLSRSKSAFGKPFELAACVRVLPQHLIVEDVKFADDTGEAVKIGDVEQSLMPGGKEISGTKRVLGAIGGDKMGMDKNLRSRIVKEVIRRHLRDCGLDVDQPAIEICRAIG